MKQDITIKKGSFKNLGKRKKYAFLFLIMYALTIVFDLIPQSYAASPPTAFYNDLIKIHGDNPDKPKWTYTEFSNRIQQIANDTVSTFISGVPFKLINLLK